MILRPSLFLVLGLTAIFPFPPARAQSPWQQRVAYEMDVTLHPDRHRMDGFQRLTYFNHSPDTLRRVFYHLYFNAFQPHSMMAERNRHLPDPDGRIVPRIWNLGPDEIGFHEILSLTRNGRPVAFEIHDTVMRVTLAEPIPPGGEAVFEMRFRSQIPLQTRRSGRDNREGIDYSMSQWYPKMAEYDERGWHADPYVGREFYGPFGTFDVRITVPADYVLGGTGVVVNAAEVGHGYADVPTPDADSLTWHFHAENVHDFAWAADPDFLHDRIEGPDGVTVHLLYQPDVAEAWQPMRAWVPQILAFYNEHVGPYPWPQFTVAQAGDGGMEYPMVNFITGRRSPFSLLGVTAHEAAHEWFYGILGSNEADYAWMDEGFTSYISGEAFMHIASRGRTPGDHRRAVQNVATALALGFADRLNTPADWFRENRAYGVAAYSGGEMIAEMLGYVISDERRDAFFKEYFRRFKFHHPDPFDVEKVAEDVSGLRLDWFFEQFLNTTRTLDYGVGSVASRRAGDGWTTTITLHRKDDVVMPVDLRLTLDGGETRWVTVPLTIMEGHKPVPEGWIVAEAWPWTSPSHTITVTLPEKVVKVELDPLERTPEQNRLDNASSFPLDVAFLRPPAPAWNRYGVGVRPLAQYTHDFGAGVGLQARGAYVLGRYRAQATVKLWPEVLFSGGDDPALDTDPRRTSFFDGIDYAASYAHPIRALGPFAALTFSARKHLGFMENEIALSTPFGSRAGAGGPHRLTVSLLHQYRASDRFFRPTGFPTLRPDFPRLHLGSLRLAYAYVKDGSRAEVTVELGGALEAVFPRDTPASANRITADFTEDLRLGRFPVRYRVRFGLGAPGLAFHKRPRLGVGSYEDRWRSAAFRNVAAAFERPLDDAHLVAFSGVGPVAYALSRTGAGRRRVILGARAARNIFAGTVTLGSGPVSAHPWLHPFEAEAFFGFGTVWNEELLGVALRDLVADAGVSLAYDVSALAPLRRWIAQSDALSGLRLVARFPLWASNPEHIARDEDAFAFRWLLGVQLR
ncbi:M1 family aminopeptidase [Rhodocaloribacter sp.]